MMEKIHIQIAKQFKKKPRPVILIPGSAHFSKTSLVMQAIKTVLPGETVLPGIKTVLAG